MKKSAMDGIQNPFRNPMMRSQFAALIRAYETKHRDLIQPDGRRETRSDMPRTAPAARLPNGKPHIVNPTSTDLANFTSVPSNSHTTGQHG